MKKYSLYFAWLIACIAAFGSLYFSEVLKLDPCHLCWYQRICIFPLVIILGLATYNGFNAIVPYVFPLVVIGFFFALYQIAIQEIPGWQPIDLCGSGPDCSEKTELGLGFLTLPMLSALALLAMLILLGIAWPRRVK